MNDVRMWVVAMWVMILVVGLLAYARGPEHHHGDDVGSHSYVGATTRL